MTYGEILGDAENNDLVGGPAAELLSGQGGDDTLTGGLGDDTLDGGEGVDTAAFDDIDVPVTVTLNADGSGVATRETGFSIAFENVAVDPITEVAFVDQAVAGNLYFNVHTNDFNGGEIRGQLDEHISDTTSEGGVRTIVLNASLDAAQEPGPTSDSIATGVGQITITVDVDGSISYSTDLSITGLATSDLLPVAGVSAIHLHNAPRGENGPVVLDVVQDAGGDINGNALVAAADTGDGDVFSEVVETDTLINIENILGSDDDDVITASGGAPNVLLGGAGDDVIAGGGGTDVIDGGEGSDTNSFANINAAAASPVGTGVTVSLNADGTGTAEYVAPNGAEIFEEFTGIENLAGSINNDAFVASGDADNVLSGGAGNDSLSGGGGDDTLIGGGGTDVIDGGEGSDTNSFENINAVAASPVGTGVTVSLNADGTGTAEYVAPNGAEIFEEFTSIENIIGSNNNDVITASGGAPNVLSGGAGDDIIAGGGGTDVIDGGEGVDTNSFANINGAAASPVGTGVTVSLNADGTGTAEYVAPNGVEIFEEFSGIENILGSNNNDVITASGGAANVLSGGAGDDIIAGGGGTDVIDGGEGIDTNSFANINGAAASPVGTGVTATLNADGTGTAEYVAPNGAEIFEEFTGIENLTGSINNDVFNTANGVANAVTGGAGDDRLITDGLDALDGGDGVDTADFSAFAANTIPNTPGAFNGVIVDLDVNSAGAAGTPGQDGAVLNSPPGAVAVGGVVPAANQIQPITDVENLVGSDFNDGLFGNNEVNVISAGGGNDLVHGFGGGDFLAGGEGIDTLLFSAAPAGVIVDLNSQVSAEAFETISAAGSGPTASSGGAGADVLSGFENVTGSANGDDVIVGDGNANVLNGQGGDDNLIGGAGDDNLIGGAGEDILNGGAGDDTALGGADDDILLGRSGEDRLIGGGGDDNLSGNRGADLIRGGQGEDVITGGGGADQLFGGGGADIIRGGAGQDNLVGNGGDDILVGGGGADRLVGSLGDDALTGGGGQDTFVFNGGSGSDVVTDFAGNDLFEITGGASEFADLDIVDTGVGALVSFGGADVLLLGVDANDLNAGDFVFS